MTSKGTDHNDTKLLLAVGALVVAGAAGIALLAGLTLDDPPRQVTGRAESGASASAARARPALSVELEPPAVTPVRFDEAAPPVVESAQAEATFEIDPAEDLVARGLETYATGEYDRAAAYFAAEVDGGPERAWTHYMLALALWKDGRADEAAAAMEELAARLDPASIKTLVNLARIRNDLGEYEPALEAGEAALAIDGADPSARFLTARSLFNLGQIDRCIERLEATLDLAPDHGYAHNLLGLARLAQQRADDAVAAFEAAAVHEPEVAFVYNNLGMALELSGRPAEAVAAYRRSVELDPGHSKAVANLARLEPLPCDPEGPADAGELAEVADDDEVLELASAEGEVVP